MNNNCCICGKPLGMSESSNLLKVGYEYRCCTDCYTKMYEVAHPTESNAASVMEFVKKINNDRDMDIEIRKLVQSIYVEAEKNVERDTALGNVPEDIKAYGQVKEESAENLKMLQGENLIVTTDTIEGYRIVSYKGDVYGDVVIGLPFLSDFGAETVNPATNKEGGYPAKMAAVKAGAKEILVKKAIAAGANAIIGVSYDYINFGNGSLGVSVNGTAVKVVKAE